MFEDPELPDFDSMSQEELIEWLEQLAQRHSEPSSEFIEHYTGDQDANDSDNPQDEWADWQDDTEPLIGVEAGPGAEFPIDADFEGEIPVDMTMLHDDDTAPTAALDWLDELTADALGDDLPDFKELQPGQPPPTALDDALAADESDNPREWLETAPEDNPGHNNPHNSPEAGDDFDEDYEDDEQLDDLEDESLYQSGAERSQEILNSLLGLVDQETEKYSTQSMAPVPEGESATAPAPETRAAPPAPAADRADEMTRAFLLQEREADLEAWYAERLREIASPGVRRSQAPELPPHVKPSKLPPPGLAAAINSARGKVKADDLPAALLDYETLLTTSAGLEWVVSDMRELIAQKQYQSVPSLHRVLGDALMRQGHLEAALDVYRHALSLL